MLATGLMHILSSLRQLLPQQRIFLSEFKKKFKSFVLITFKSVLLAVFLLFHMLLFPGLGSEVDWSFLTPFHSLYLRICLENERNEFKVALGWEEKEYLSVLDELLFPLRLLNELYEETLAWERGIVLL